jgi:hypothetical protein
MTSRPPISGGQRQPAERIDPRATIITPLAGPNLNQKTTPGKGWLMSRGLNFARNADIGQIGHLWMGANERLSTNRKIWPRSRRAENLTAGIWLIFRGLNFARNADIGQIGHLWMGAN